MIAPDATTQSPDLADDDIAVLTRLRDICMRAAEALGCAIEEAVLSDSNVNEAGKAALGQSLTRIARAVRQTIALKKRLAEDRKVLLDTDHAKRAEALKAQSEADAALAAERTKAAHAAKVSRGLANKLEAGIEIENLIESLSDGHYREDLLADLREILDDDPADHRFADMSMAQIIEHIRDELGADLDWAKLADPDLDAKHLRDRMKRARAAGHPPGDDPDISPD